ncbi:MAG: hypothetical protein GY822_29295 [Deltaproteobacteria bacterium]|nr:hypothetical protein [Deltaproteobacteria bacterium]
MNDAAILKYAEDQPNPEECLRNAKKIRKKNRRQLTQLRCIQRADLVRPKRILQTQELRKLVLEKSNRGILAQLLAHEGATDLRGMTLVHKLPFVSLTDALGNLQKYSGREVLFRGHIVRTRTKSKATFLLLDQTTPAPVYGEKTGFRSVLVGRKWIKVPGLVSKGSTFTGQSIAVRLDKGLNVSEEMFDKGDFVVIGRLIKPDPYATNKANPWKKQLQSVMIVDAAVVAPIYGRKIFFDKN